MDSMPAYYGRMQAVADNHDSLDAFFYEQLEWIDGVLAAMDKPPWGRPLDAGMLFVRLFLEAVGEGGVEEVIDGEKPEQYLTRPWFKKLMHQIGEWYATKYDSAMQVPESRRFRSIVILHDTPFGLSIPMTLKRPGRPGETVQIVFAVDIQPDEHVMDYVIKPPNMTVTAWREKHRTQRRIERIVRTVRKIHNNLYWSERTCPEVDGLQRAVQAHLDQAVDELLDHGRQGVGGALYELHMAVEKALKLVVLQREGKHIGTHDLTVLLRDAARVSNKLQMTKLPEGMPSVKEVNDYRYGTNPRMGVIAAVRVYYRVLAFLLPVTAALKWKVRADNAVFEIRRVPWASSFRG